MDFRVEKETYLLTLGPPVYPFQNSFQKMAKNSLINEKPITSLQYL